MKQFAFLQKTIFSKNTLTRKRFFSQHDDPSHSVVAWLISKGVEENIALGMMRAFPSPPTISELKGFGNQGITALADSVRREQSKVLSHEKVSIYVRIPQEQQVQNYAVKEGQSIYDVVMENQEGLGPYLECACRGIAACSTCHVYIDKEYLSKLPPPDDSELDMLDLAWGLKENSRLGCQLRFTKKVDGMTITIPEGVNNLYSIKM
jgi:ferredoxin